MQVSPCHTCLMLSIKYKILLDRCILRSSAPFGTNSLQSFPSQARKESSSLPLAARLSQPLGYHQEAGHVVACFMQGYAGAHLPHTYSNVKISRKKGIRQTYRRYRAFHSSSEWQKAYRNLHVDPRFRRDCLSKPSRTRARISSGKQAHEPMLLRAFGPLARY